MNVPSTESQLLIILLFVLPGAVFQAARLRLRGSVPSDQSATTMLLRALSISTFLNAVYLWFFGSSLIGLYHSVAGIGQSAGRANLTQKDGLVALLLLFVVPSLLALADYGRTRLGWVARKLPQFGAFASRVRLSYVSTPQAWDYSFVAREPCFVRVRIGDAWFGGWYGTRSYSTAYPEPQQLFLETAWVMSSEGEFLEEVAGSAGLFIRCADAQLVEFLAPIPPAASQPPASA